MNHLSCFTGIGGFDLAAEWLGWNNVQAIEIAEYPRRVLQQNFPGLQIATDIKKFDARHLRGMIDIVSGGFPCQPFSTLGKLKRGNDHRAIWHEMERIIDECEPAFAVGENIYELLGTNELDCILQSMEAKGFTSEIFIIPACSVGAFHNRKRLWILFTYTDTINRTIRCKERLRLHNSQNKIQLLRNNTPNDVKSMYLQYSSLPAITELCGMHDGLPHRMDRIKALGNAVVPQIPYLIFKALEDSILASDNE